MFFHWLILSGHPRLLKSDKWKASQCKAPFGFWASTMVIIQGSSRVGATEVAEAFKHCQTLLLETNLVSFQLFVLLL